MGLLGSRWMTSGGDPKGAVGEEKEREVAYWVAPMDANYRRDEPGKSPMGMDLVPVYADEAGHGAAGTVKIDPTVVNNLGVRTEVVSIGVMNRRIETVGYIGYDEDSLHQINTRVDGWIEKLLIKNDGEPVTRGQVLFELYSPTLVNAQVEYLAALAGRSSSLRKASRDRLAALGVTAGQIDALRKSRKAAQRIQIRARADGLVTRLMVREGVYVTPATAIMSVARLDSVWVLAEVFERQSDWVRVGQAADVRLDYLPGRIWRGKVDFIYPELDPVTRTLKVRLRVDNSDETLRPNMFARITIEGTATEPVVNIPAQALIRGGRLNRVVVALGDGRFRSKAVEVGIESGDRVEIRSGLDRGDLVVTSGQFLIDSESNLEAEFARMGDKEPSP
jgi:Cu(I)/Ag(I) efflux system membrane fusion protein